jgi:hypothetical protein
MERLLHVNVTYQPELEYVSAANDHVRSVTALSLDGLRKRIIVAFLGRPGRRDRSITVNLTLDAAAQAEFTRRGRPPTIV